MTQLERLLAPFEREGYTVEVGRDAGGWSLCIARDDPEEPLALRVYGELRDLRKALQRHLQSGAAPRLPSPPTDHQDIPGEALS